MKQKILRHSKKCTVRSGIGSGDSRARVQTPVLTTTKRRMYCQHNYRSGCFCLFDNRLFISPVEKLAVTCFCFSGFFFFFGCIQV
jgi:hypothetical protein